MPTKQETTAELLERMERWGTTLVEECEFTAGWTEDSGLAQSNLVSAAQHLADIRELRERIQPRLQGRVIQP